MRYAVAVGLGEQPCQPRLVDAAHLGQPRLDRRQPLRLDRPSVEIGGVGAADLAVRVALCRFQYVARALLRQVGEFGERSEEHTSELQSLMRISYAVFC